MSVNIYYLVIYIVIYKLSVVLHFFYLVVEYIILLLHVISWFIPISPIFHFSKESAEDWRVTVQFWYPLHIQLAKIFGTPYVECKFSKVSSAFSVRITVLRNCIDSIGGKHQILPRNMFSLVLLGKRRS